MRRIHDLPGRRARRARCSRRLSAPVAPRTSRHRPAPSTSPRTRRPRREIMMIKTGVTAYVQMNGVAPPAADAATLGNFVQPWPKNPWTQAPMEQGKEPGDIAYAPGAGTAYTLGVVVSDGVGVQRALTAEGPPVMKAQVAADGPRVRPFGPSPGSAPATERRPCRAVRRGGPAGRRVRLLDAMLVSLLALAAVSFCVVLVVDSSGTPRRDRVPGADRRRPGAAGGGSGPEPHPPVSAAATLTVACAVLAPWASAAIDPTVFSGDFVPLTYVVVPVLLCGILLSAAVTALVGVRAGRRARRVRRGARPDRPHQLAQPVHHGPHGVGAEHRRQPHDQGRHGPDRAAEPATRGERGPSARAVGA